MDWVFIMWITLGGGHVTTQKTTEAQCKSLIAMYEKTVDPIMAYCAGPRGETLRTSDIRDRMAKRLPPNPNGGPVAAPKAAGGI